ncbi:hypothetical protein J6E39_01255 [bacterium]|nr:hypothetical protein [bacterium]
MNRILFITSNSEISKKFSEIFSSKSLFDYTTSSDKTMILDMVNVFPPDIIITDAISKDVDYKEILRKIKIINDNIIIILYSKDEIQRELAKYANAIITPSMSDSLINSIIQMNLKTKNSLEKLSNTNRDLAESLYRLNTLYNTSSQFAGTLDKEKLLNYMIEGMDKALSFSLTILLSFCSENEPVLILNSLYEISDELMSAIKLRTILNYKSLFDGKELPYELDEKNLKIVKLVKHPANRFTFNLFQFDNMFTPINLGDDFFGCVEIFKDVSFSTEDATCFQTIARQVTLPLKSAILYQELIETNKKLEKLERMKSEFISIVSHELRTPLTSIKNSLDILSGGRCGEITENAAKFFDMAKRNVQGLSRIINDLLDLSKIEAGKMTFNFKTTNIKPVIEYVKSSLSGVAKSANLNLVVNIDENLPDITADSQRLEQVLTNLVSNAIKFTPSGKNIYINAALTNSENIKQNEVFAEDISKLSGDYILVSVKDEGIGIDSKDLLRAFDKFAQIENSLSRKVGGTGLGLPIAKQLLEAHKGTIWCESELDKGSTFYFAVPIIKTPEFAAL